MSESHQKYDPSGLALADGLRVIAGKLKRRLRGHGSLDDLTPPQAAVLAHLDRDGPATVSGLACAEGMRPQSMKNIVAVLAERIAWKLMVSGQTYATGRVSATAAA